LTSATLAPIKILRYDLDTEFKVQLVGQHFIRQQQVFATILPHDFEGNRFKFNFDNKDLGKSYKDLAKLVKKLLTTIKGGMLMFFTSQTHITDCLKQFTDSKMISCRIFIEDKDPQQALKNFEQYKEAV
jgi:Rad3-related DNA helicase